MEVGFYTRTCVCVCVCVCACVCVRVCARVARVIARNFRPAYACEYWSDVQTPHNRRKPRTHESSFRSVRHTHTSHTRTFTDLCVGVQEQLADTEPSHAHITHTHTQTHSLTHALSDPRLGVPERHGDTERSHATSLTHALLDLCFAVSQLLHTHTSLTHTHFQICVQEYQSGFARIPLTHTHFQIRVLEYQSGLETPGVPDYLVKRMYLSNAVVNPFLSIAFYMSGVAARLCRRCGGKNADGGATTEVTY